MKAITIWQPWSSLIALGEKRIETRHWYTGYRGPIAIHAAKKWHTDALDAVFVDWQDPVFDTPILAALKRHGVKALADLSLGAVIATANLVACVRFTESSTYRLPNGETIDIATETEFGDFSLGRYGWVLADVQPLATPFPVRGQQGLWDVCLPREEALAS